MAEQQYVSVSVSDSWGIGCLRQAAGFPVGKENKFQYVCPLGPSIVVWDIEKKQRILSKQVAHDFISILIKNDALDLILMISYSGQGKLFDSQLADACSFKVPGNNVIYASWLTGQTLFGVCTIGNMSAVSLFEVSADKTEVSLKWSVKASEVNKMLFEQESFHGIKAKEVNNENEDGLVKSSDGKPVDNYKSYYGSMFSEEKKIIAIFNKQNSPCEVHLFNIDGKFLQKQLISPLGDSRTSMMCMSECRNGKFAIGMERGIFVFVQSNSLEILSVFQSQGSAQVCIWDNDMLVTIAYQSGVIQWWSGSAEVIKEIKVGNMESVVHLNWSMPGKELWIGCITSLNYVSVEPNPVPHQNSAPSSKVLSLIEHRVAGCGLSFKDNSTLATGDLVGNVFINQMGADFNFDDSQGKINVKSSVRCLEWINDTLFIGTLEGTLFNWVATCENVKQTYDLIYTFPFGVLSMRKSNSMKLLAIGTGGGDVYIFDTQNSFSLILETRTHMPQIVSPGMENTFMEIWSIAWEPSDDLIATASEDRTSVVTDAKTGAHYSFSYLLVNIK